MDIKEIMQIDSQYYCPVFDSRMPVHFVDAEDVFLFDGIGGRYIDFLSGIAVNCLGYSDRGFKKALCDTINSLMHTSNYFYSEKQAMFARLICEQTGYDNVFLANSGAEAMEGALKLARKYHSAQPRTHFVSMRQSFHGRTLATLAATGQQKFHTAFEPLIFDFDYVSPNNICALENAVSEKTAAVIIEPILGEGGIIEIEPEYFCAVRNICDKYGALMIADEIQTGMGRTGELLASPSLGALPDVVVLAKSLGSGIPVGAFLARGEAAQALCTGDHGSTFGGNYLASAAALYVTEKLVHTNIMDNVTNMGAYFKQKLIDITQNCCHILDVRGRGLMLGIRLGETLSAKAVQISLLRKGFVTATAGQNVLRFLPPYTIRSIHIDKLCDALQSLLESV